MNTSSQRDDWVMRPTRLFVGADLANWFLEIDNANNTTWADIKLTQKAVRVLSYGPSA
jgi:hypothetical protein